MKVTLDNLFSIENSLDERHKIIRILGIKLKIKNKKNINDFISHEVFAANFIKDLHTKYILPYKNCNDGKDIVIIATGPTLKFYKQLQNAVHIGVNKAFQKNDMKLNYIFTGDYSVNKPYIEDFINYPEAVKFIGTNFSSELNSIKYTIIPVKYFERKDVNFYVSDYPRNLQSPHLQYCGLMDFTSVVFNAAHFATYTNPKRIYLVGCDCSSGYFDGSKMKGNSIRLTKGWQKFKVYVNTYYPDMEIISINPVGLKGLFKDIYTKDYVNDNLNLFKNLEQIEYLD